MNDLFFYPMIVHVFWTALLYLGLTVVRAPKVWAVGQRRDGSNPWEMYEPRISANLSNQFEWPLLFYTACVYISLRPSLFHDLYLWLAWTFVVGRILHSVVQIYIENLRLRGLVFSINFIAVLLMWAALGVNLLLD